MKKINLESLQVKKKNVVPVLTARQAMISINKEALLCFFPQLETIDEKMTCYIELGQDEENLQLHIRASLEYVEGAAFMKPKQSGHKTVNEWICHGKALTEFIKGIAGCNDSSVPCRIQSQARTPEGWYPVITTYWKSKKP
jgi:hypothetical protein